MSLYVILPPGDDPCFPRTVELALSSIYPGWTLDPAWDPCAAGAPTEIEVVFTEPPYKATYCRHPIGYTLARGLNDTEIVVTINYSTGGSWYSPLDRSVSWNPYGNTDGCCEDYLCLWGDKREHPAAAILAHELLHALHDVEGDYYSGCDEEERTTCQENQIRVELGVAARRGYSGCTPPLCPLGSCSGLELKPVEPPPFDCGEVEPPPEAEEGDPVPVEPGPSWPGGCCRAIWLMLWRLFRFPSIWRFTRRSAALRRVLQRRFEAEFDWLLHLPGPIGGKLANAARILVRRRHLQSTPAVEQEFERSETVGRLELVLAHGGYLLIQFKSNGDGTGTFVSNVVPRTSQGGARYLMGGDLVSRRITAADWGRIEDLLDSAIRDGLPDQSVAGDPRVADGAAQFIRVKAANDDRCAATLNFTIPTTHDGTEGLVSDPDEFRVWNAMKNLLVTGVELALSEPRGDVLKFR